MRARVDQARDRGDQADYSRGRSTRRKQTRSSSARSFAYLCPNWIAEIRELLLNFLMLFCIVPPAVVFLQRDILFLIPVRFRPLYHPLIHLNRHHGGISPLPGTEQGAADEARNALFGPLHFIMFSAQLRRRSAFSVSLTAVMRECGPAAPDALLVIVM